jgi:ATP-binding cassette subfamily B protein
VIKGFFLFLKGKWSAVAAESIAKRMKEKLYDHLQRQPFEYHVKAQTGDLVQRCTSDVETVRQFLAVQLVEIGRAFFLVGFSLMIMLSLSREMTMVSMVIVPLIFGFAYSFFKKVKKVFKKTDEAEGKLSSILQESLTGVRVVRAFARQNFEMDRFDGRNRAYSDNMYELIKLMAWYWSISSFLSMIQVSVILIFGIYFTASGAITLGALVVFLTYEGMLLWPIRQLGRILTDMGKSIIALERIGEILDSPIEKDNESAKEVDVRGNIVFDNVSFNYDDGEPVLNEVSFSVKQGETVAILGPTGSGKSSLMHLLTGLYDLKNGRILIEGVDLKLIKKECLRKNIGIVLQEAFLFSKTLKENISLANKRAKDKEVSDAAKIAYVHDVIESFDDGYYTSVGERGVTLSGGQKQRVAIARILVQRAPVLIFDDSLSAVDTETDAGIRKALKERSKDVTTFIISHRITTLSQADKIIVLDAGKVVQMGTHEELLKIDGLYHRIWKIQNRLEEECDDGDV